MYQCLKGSVDRTLWFLQLWFEGTGLKTKFDNVKVIFICLPLNHVIHLLP